MSNVKNLQALGKLKGVCTRSGGYKPGQPNLQEDALNSLENNAQQVLMEFSLAQTSFDNATNRRVLGFREARKLSSRIVSMLKSCGANHLTIEDALASHRKLSGTRKSKRPLALPTAQAAGAGEVPKVRTHGRDYASMEYYFGRLVNTVAAEVRYMPTEFELSVPGLRAKANELHDLNKAVMQAEVNLNGVRQKRNAIFYSEDGLYATAMAVKNYVRGAFGFSSDQRAEVSKLRFDKPNE